MTEANPEPNVVNPLKQQQPQVNPLKQQQPHVNPLKQQQPHVNPLKQQQPQVQLEQPVTTSDRVSLTQEPQDPRGNGAEEWISRRPSAGSVVLKVAGRVHNAANMDHQSVYPLSPK